MLILVIDDWHISCEIAIRRMQLDLTDDKSTLVQVMAWCRQTPSHYLSQCWPRFMSPYGIIRPQWVKLINSLQKLWAISSTMRQKTMESETKFFKMLWEVPELTQNEGFAIRMPSGLFNSLLVWDKWPWNQSPSTLRRDWKGLSIRQFKDNFPSASLIYQGSSAIIEFQW